RSATSSASLSLSTGRMTHPRRDGSTKIRRTKFLSTLPSQKTSLPVRAGAGPGCCSSRAAGETSSRRRGRYADSPQLYQRAVHFRVSAAIFPCPVGLLFPHLAETAYSSQSRTRQTPAYSAARRPRERLFASLLQT